MSSEFVSWLGAQLSPAVFAGTATAFIVIAVLSIAPLFIDALPGGKKDT